MGHFLQEEEGPHPQGGEGHHHQEDGGLHHQGKGGLHPPEGESLRHPEGEGLHHLGKEDLHRPEENDPLLQGEGDFPLKRPCLHPLAATQGDLPHLTHQEEREAHPGAVAAVAAALQELQGEFPFPADTTGAFTLNFLAFVSFHFSEAEAAILVQALQVTPLLILQGNKYCHHHHQTP